MLIEIILASGITYTNDAKPIFQKHCAQCHNANWPAKNWLDYETAKKNSLQIKNRVAIFKNMPPGNPTNMTEAERQKIKDWVDQGAKK